MGVAVLMMSAAVLFSQPQSGDASRSGKVSLTGDKLAGCKAKSVQTTFGYLGCNPELGGQGRNDRTVRIVGGSRFISTGKTS